MVKCLVLVISLLSWSVLYGGELSSGQSEFGDSTVDYQGRLVRKPKSCTAQEFAERVGRQNECIKNFSKFRIQKSIKPNELINIKECPSAIDKFDDFVVGCAGGLLEMGIESVAAIGSLVFDTELIRAATQACGEKPVFHAAKLDFASNPEIVAQLKKYRIYDRYIKYSYDPGEQNKEDGTYPDLDRRKAQQAWRVIEKLHDYCMVQESKKFSRKRKRDRQTAEEKQIQAEIVQEQTENTIIGLRKTCRKKFRISLGGPIRLKSKRHAVQSCMLEEAGRVNCSECIKQLAPAPEMDDGSSFYDAMYALYQKIYGEGYAALQCYNSKQIGRMMCPIGFTLLTGGTLAGIKAATKLPALARGMSKLIKKNARPPDPKAVARKTTGPQAGDSAQTAAARAAAEANDSLETRKTFAENLLRDKGLLGDNEFLSPEQAQAIWKAHSEFGDEGLEITRGALVLKKAGFNKEQIRALNEGKVTGGYSFKEVQALKVPNGYKTGPDGRPQLLTEDEIRTNQDAFFGQEKYLQAVFDPKTPTDFGIDDVMGQYRHLAQAVRDNADGRQVVNLFKFDKATTVKPAEMVNRKKIRALLIDYETRQKGGGGARLTSAVEADLAKMRTDLKALGYPEGWPISDSDSISFVTSGVKASVRQGGKDIQRSNHILYVEIQEKYAASRIALNVLGRMKKGEVIPGTADLNPREIEAHITEIKRIQGALEQALSTPRFKNI